MGCILKGILYSILLFVGLILFLIYLPLIDINCVSYKLDPPPDFVGPLASNEILSRAEKLFENEILGPESVIQYKGGIYTGLSDGRIIRIVGKEYQTVANIGADCNSSGLWDQFKCGRPLGLRFDSKGTLYAVDAYFGLKSIDIETGKVSMVFNMQTTPIDGRKSRFFDDVALDEGSGRNGGNVFYVSDASTKWDSDFHVGITAEHESTGRLVRIDADTGEATAVVDGVGFANGVEMTDDKSAVIYSELNSRRLMKYHIKGAKKGRREVFTDNLPGEPDNVRRSADTAETYWVALFSGRNGTHPHFFMDSLQERPFTRKAIAQLVHNLGAALFWIGHSLSFHPLMDIGFKLKSGFLFATSIAERGLVLEIDSRGNIIRSLHSPDKTVTALSEVRDVIEGGKRVLYLGSYYNYYLGRITL